ncbi:PEP-CTERM sorting domain-containing protein [Luteolibacter arcticus]|uniref:PEP-CTERM sorting domain-containing protein n=1 Tax=Luteolibacter arcticus TaxID=1581411 RepID=UPI0034E0C024
MPSRHVLILASIALIHSESATGAVIAPDINRFSYDFTLTRTGASSSDTLDQFGIRFGDDKLDSGEVLWVTVLAKGQSEPVLSQALHGVPNGYGGFLFLRDWNTAFPEWQGSVIFEITSGTVDLEGFSIGIIAPPDRRALAPSLDIRLVPEPSSMGLIGLLAAMWRRRRSNIPDSAQPDAETRTLAPYDHATCRSTLIRRCSMMKSWRSGVFLPM